MDTIIVGMFLSFVFSFVSPWLEKHYGFNNDRAKMVIILVLSFALALVTYIAPQQYLQTAMVILGSATSIYWILWKIAFKSDKIEDLSREILK
jgi:predicted PurR-regulated permease PerM